VVGYVALDARLMATTLLVGAIYAAVNILVDVVQGWLDPRLGHA
jgi:ABC-type dipeptide/oligopeptide/nickel transport system permease component